MERALAPGRVSVSRPPHELVCGGLEYGPCPEHFVRGRLGPEAHRRRLKRRRNQVGERGGCRRSCRRARGRHRPRQLDCADVASTLMRPSQLAKKRGAQQRALDCADVSRRVDAAERVHNNVLLIAPMSRAAWTPRCFRLHTRVHVALPGTASPLYLPARASKPSAHARGGPLRVRADVYARARASSAPLENPDRRLFSILEKRLERDDGEELERARCRWSPSLRADASPRSSRRECQRCIRFACQRCFRLHTHTGSRPDRRRVKCPGPGPYSTPRAAAPEAAALTLTRPGAKARPIPRLCLPARASKWRAHARGGPAAHAR
jgi:hypothetical protein